MILDCPACGARYRLADDALPAEGKSVRCAKCLHRWWQLAPTLPQPASELAAFDLPAPLEEADEVAAAVPPPLPFVRGPLASPVDVAADQRYEASRTQPLPPAQRPPAAQPDPTPAASLAPPDRAAKRSAAAVARPASPLAPAQGGASVSPSASVPAAAAAAASAAPLATPGPARRRPRLLYAVLVAAVVTAVAGVVLGRLPGLPPVDLTQVPIIGDWLDAQFSPPAPPPSPLRIAAAAQFSVLARGDRMVALSGEVINPTASAQPVPTIEALMIDEARVVVGRWRIAPPAAIIAPGAHLRFDSSASGFAPTVSRITLRFDAAR